MLKGKAVKEYFKEHPESLKAIENIQFQFKLPSQAEGNEDIYRALTVDDIHFISFEGWEGQKGVFAWFYPCGVPHYCKIAD